MPSMRSMAAKGAIISGEGRGKDKATPNLGQVGKSLSTREKRGKLN